MVIPECYKGFISLEPNPNTNKLEFKCDICSNDEGLIKFFLKFSIKINLLNYFYSYQPY